MCIVKDKENYLSILSVFNFLKIRKETSRKKKAAKKGTKGEEEEEEDILSIFFCFPIDYV